MLSSTLSVVLRKRTLHLFWWPTMQGADLTIGSNFGVQCPRTLGQVDRRSRESKPSASWATLTQRRMMQPFSLFTKHGYLTSCGCKSIKRSKYAVLCRKFVKKRSGWNVPNVLPVFLWSAALLSTIPIKIRTPWSRFDIHMDCNIVEVQKKENISTVNLDVSLALCRLPWLWNCLVVTSCFTSACVSIE